jgi:glycosyltransferase involved in cell wall biosynthesis
MPGRIFNLSMGNWHRTGDKCLKGGTTQQGKMEEAKKKLLFVNSHLPYPIDQGISARVINLLQSFSRRFEVDLICRLRFKERAVYIPQVKMYCHQLETFLAPNSRTQLHRLLYKISFAFSHLFKGTPADLFYNNLPAIKRKLLNRIRSDSYDVIFFEYWYWDKDLIQAGNAIKVVDTNDFQFLRESRIREKKSNILFKPFIRFQMNHYLQMELRSLNLFDLIVATNKEDKKSFQKYLGANKEIIISATGVDTEYFSPRETNAEEDSLIFYGAMANPINIDGALYLCKEIMPLIWEKKKEATLIIVGNNPPPEIKALASDPRIIVTGFVEDVRDYLAKGRLLVLPLTYGFGHRGRVFEVMAMGIPIVVTPQAILGMGLKNGEGLLIEESPLYFAQRVLNILDNREYARELGREGRRLVLERFSRQATYDRLTDFLFEYQKR